MPDSVADTKFPGSSSIAAAGLGVIAAGLYVSQALKSSQTTGSITTTVMGSKSTADVSTVDNHGRGTTTSSESALINANNGNVLMSTNVDAYSTLQQLFGLAYDDLIPLSDGIIEAFQNG